MSLDFQVVLHELKEARHKSGHSRTATMTLVCFLDDSGTAGWARDRVRLIANKHPSRVIILDGSRDATLQLVEETTAHGEWIELGVKGATGQLLDGAVSTLALTEAPIVLIWGAPETGTDPRFSLLTKRARTVICSTSLVTNEATALRDLATFVSTHYRVAVADLAYLRLAPWQECIAGFFDDAEIAQELEHLERVDITAGSDPEAYYLVGWLESRLNRKLAFTVDHHAEPRRLRRVALRSARASFVAEVTDDDPDAIVLDVEAHSGKRHRCGPLGGIDIASLVERAILHASGDLVFRESLAAANTLVPEKA